MTDPRHEPARQARQAGQAAGSLLQAYWPKRFRTRHFKARPGFGTSHWFCFQEAVIAHQAYVMDMHKDRYAQIRAAVQKVL